MSILKAGFKFIIQQAGFEVTLISNLNGSSYTVRMAKANRDRKLDALEETTYQGNEFVVTVDDLEAVSYPLPPRRGDQIENADFGTNSVTEVVPQVTLGEVIGYRLRVG